MTCTPYDATTNTGGFCFSSLLCRVLGVKYEDQCIACFAAAGYTVDNAARPTERTYPAPSLDTWQLPH
jgi:hypothetical protein